MTLTYGVVFSVSFFLAFLAFYLFAARSIENHRDGQVADEMEEYQSFLKARSFEELKAALLFETRAHDTNKVFCRVVGVDGGKLFESEMDGWHEVAVKVDVVKDVVENGIYRFETLPIPNRSETLRVVYGPLTQDKAIQWGVISTEEDTFLAHTRDIFLTQLCVIVLLATVLGWFASRRAISGVEEVTRIAENIAAKGKLNQRVSVNSKVTEVKRLANTFNHMLDRICSLVNGIREVTDNIAHDLKSPLTRLKSMSEITLTTGVSIGEYQNLAANVIEEADNLLTTINSLLEIAEVSSGAGSLNLENVDIADLVREACDLFLPLAENKQLSLIFNGPETLTLTGDLKKLQRMVANILDNAIKYTPNGGEIKVELRKKPEKAVISIKDTGIGIAPDDLPKIKQRFFRCDQSRSFPGAGLGLNLAFTIAESHGGEIHVKSAPGKGSVFTIRLPTNQSMMVEKIREES